MPQSAVSCVLDRVVQVGSCQYPVLVRAGRGARDALTRAARELGATRFLVVTSTGVPARQLGAVLAALTPLAPVLVLRGDGHHCRFPEPTVDTVVVAVGDQRIVRPALASAGRARVLLVPTTLAAMCDASVLVHWDAAAGCLRAPALVWCRPDLLTGPQHAGLYPLLRDVLAICPYHYASVAERLRTDGRYDPAVLASFVALCVEARAGVLAYDPFGRGPGAVLGYGQGSAQGLLLAARVAGRLGLLDPAAEAAHLELLARAGLPTGAPTGAPTRVGARELVLLDALGQPHVTAGSLLTPVEPAIEPTVEPLVEPAVPPARADGPTPVAQPVG